MDPVMPRSRRNGVTVQYHSLCFFPFPDINGLCLFGEVGRVGIMNSDPISSIVALT